MDIRRISGLVAAVALCSVPMLAGATNLSVSVSVPSDCKVTTTGSLTLAFGTINLIRNAHAATPTTQVGVQCNNGTIWHLAVDNSGSAPADLTSTGYSHAFTQNSAVTYTVTTDILGSTSTTSLAPTNVSLTGRLNTLDPPVGTYTDSFVLSVMI